MALPERWIDLLFGRLSVRYGAAFLRQWPADADPAVLKADWAQVLDRVSKEAITYALECLPPVPPNALQFRDLCRRAPGPNVPALPAPELRADPARVRALVAGAKVANLDGLPPAQRCAAGILARARAAGGVTHAQRHMLQAMAARLSPQQLQEAAQWVPDVLEQPACVEGV